MWFFDIFKWQAIDIIRWENPQDELLVWKWPHNLDEIKNNSTLIVDPGLSAIFVHNGKIEAIQSDNWMWSLETDNIPFLSSMKNIMSWFQTHDKAAVFFLKTNKIANQKWWTPNTVTYIDPIYDFPVELRAFGNFTFTIFDLDNFWLNYVANSAEVLTDDIRMFIADRIIWNVASIFASKKISYNEIDAYTLEIAKELTKATKDEFSKLGLELVDFRIEDINFSDKTNGFIDKITSKSADVWAINKTSNIDRSAMANYAELEKLNIMNKAAESGWSAWDMMWAGVWMAMWMHMNNSLGNNSNPSQPSLNTNGRSNNIEESAELKLEKIKSLLDKKLITQEDYDKKKDEIISEM